MAHIRKLKSGKWQATVRHPSGQRWSKSDPLKRVVQQWAADKEAEMRRGEFVDPVGGRMTLAVWREKWLETRRVEISSGDRDLSQWRNHIEPNFGTWPLSSIQSWDVEAWVTQMEEKKVGATTVVASLRQLRLMLQDAVVKHKLITANPAEGVTATMPEPHVDRVLTRNEAEMLLEQFDGVDRVFVEMLLYCGLRFQEAAGLRRFRVDLLRKQIQIVKVQPRKGAEKGPKTRAGVRKVPLTDELAVKLSKLIPALDHELVFTSPQGARVRYEHWYPRVWKPSLRRAKLADPQPTPHDLRHAYGTWLGEAGVQPAQIAALMGHKSLKSVERYVHPTDARFDQARAALAKPERQESGRAPDQHRTP